MILSRIQYQNDALGHLRLYFHLFCLVSPSCPSARASSEIPALRCMHYIPMYKLLLIALADLPGWPLLSPVKIQMQKCDKCSREFFSPINYRRHTRVHHRLKMLDKVQKQTRHYQSSRSDDLDYIHFAMKKESFLCCRKFLSALQLLILFLMPLSLLSSAFLG